MLDPQPGVDLVTVTSADFLVGTHVMLDSFLHHNRWFDGTIRIIHDDLDQPAQAGLAACFPRLGCRRPGQQLTDQIARLVAARPGLAGRTRRFYSLDLFFGDGINSTLFIDSDIVFRGSVEAALDSGAGIAACADRAQLVGNSRDPETLAEVAREQGAERFNSFNAGFMVVQPGLCSAMVQARILALMEPAQWAAIASDHTDQAVLNRAFGFDVALLDPSFNRMVGHAAAAVKERSLPVEHAAALHFNGPAKPWRLDENVQRMAADADYGFALEQWHAAYRRFLARRAGL